MQEKTQKQRGGTLRLVRRFGEEFYKALEAAEELIRQQ